MDLITLTNEKERRANETPNIRKDVHGTVDLKLVGKKLVTLPDTIRSCNAKLVLADPFSLGHVGKSNTFWTFKSVLNDCVESADRY